MFKSRPSGGMLGSVGAKIAHASTIPSLGNPDLRTLQDLITAEKGVLLSVQRLAGDVGKGAESLRNWGAGEGDDLGDVLGHSTNLLAQFSAALTQFASYEEAVRSQLKSIRTREENLDEMRRRKRNVDHKADGADKKLAKMGPEHKGRQAQVELLNELKEEGRRLEIDIMNEDAAIGDYKRRTTREFMALKFAAMVELAEKATIIGDLGKLMIEEIPLHITPPGHPRVPYSGREKTSELSSEAMRCINEIKLNLPSVPESAPAPATYEPYQPNDARPPVPGGDYDQGTFGSASPRGQGFYNEFGETERPAGSGFSTGSLRIADDGSRIGNTGAGQFHTLPASAGSNFSGGLPPITLVDHGREDTFSSSVADALSHDPNFYGHRDVGTPPPQQQSVPTTFTPPPPQPPIQTRSFTPPPQPSVPTGTYAPPPGPPPGALPPIQPSQSYFGPLPDFNQPSSPLVPHNAFSPGSPWANPPSPTKSSRPLPSHPPQAPPQAPPQEPDEGRSDLAYARDPSPVPPSPVPAQTTHAQTTTDNHFPNPYADTARNQTPSPQPGRDQSPVRDPDQEHREATNAAAREVSREMDVLAMAPYASSPPRPASQSTGFSSPPRFNAQLSSYGPTPGSTYAPPPGPPPGQSAGTPSALGDLLDSTYAPTPPQGSTYGTPPEHPNPFSSPLPRLPHLPSAAPLASPPPGSPTTTGRMISAGAFRRNVSRSDTLDPGMSSPPAVSPLAVRKKTPGGEDTSRGSSPAPTSPGAPPTYSAIDDLHMGRSLSPPGGGFGNGDSKPLPRPE